jgi:hypothetical protein
MLLVEKENLLTLSLKELQNTNCEQTAAGTIQNVPLFQRAPEHRGSQMILQMVR